MSSTAAYDPSSDSWSAFPSLTTARCAHQAVSTGTGILTFGGLSDCSNGTTTTPGLESYTPSGASGTWAAVSDAGEPEHRYNFAMAWTSAGLFVYGGSTSSQSAVASGATLPAVGTSWVDASCPLVGGERAGGSVFLDGSVIRFWGGGFGNAPNGLTYDPKNRIWSEWSVPAGTTDHLAAGSMWRVVDDGRRLYYLTATNTVSIYDRKTASWLANDTALMPPGFCVEAAAAWTGSEMIAWSGSCGGAPPVDVGGRYQPAAPN